MGIRYLNGYLSHNCKKTSISKQHLSTIRDKTIVIDVSIYLYKYISQGALHENIYLMISLFHKYNITPIFVFDGKPPPEKMEELQKRRYLKIDAEEKYHLLSDKLNNTDDLTLRNKMINEMDQLKRQFVRVYEKDIVSVKEIMDAFGVQYYNATGEADKICAMIQLDEKHNCYACLSDDMDMFVYGCSRVIRHFSLMNETMIVYNRDDILTDLKLSFPLFRQIAVLSGTDYNINDNDVSLNETMKWYNEFVKNVHNDELNIEYGFYKWLNNNTKYIKNYESLLEIHHMFTLTETIDDINIKLCKDYDVKHLQSIMSNYGFIFCNL
jgi:5'-3' exonuclease